MDGKGRMGPCVCMAKSLRCSSGTVTTLLISDQFSSVAQSCLTLCDPVNCSTPGFPVYHQLPEFTQTHVHRVSDAIQPSHPLSSPSQVEKKMVKKKEKAKVGMRKGKDLKHWWNKHLTGAPLISLEAGICEKFFQYL